MCQEGLAARGGRGPHVGSARCEHQAQAWHNPGNGVHSFVGTERGTGTQHQQGALLSTRPYLRWMESLWEDEPCADLPGAVRRCHGGNPSNTTKGLCSKAKSPRTRMGEAKSPQVPQLTVPGCRTILHTWWEEAGVCPNIICSLFLLPVIFSANTVTPSTFKSILSSALGEDLIKQ